MSQRARVLHLAEPPSTYLFRPALVVDCSVLSAVLFEEQTRDAALQILTGKSLHAPSVLDHEIVSVALKKARGTGHGFGGVSNGSAAGAGRTAARGLPARAFSARPTTAPEIVATSKRKSILSRMKDRRS